MGKILLFFAVVLVGTVVLLALSNQQVKTPKTPDLGESNASPTPLGISPIPSRTVTEKMNQTATQSATATIYTEKGNIVLLLYSDDAPKTVTNFVSKATSGFYNNLTFHRVEDWVIQGGDPKGDGTGGGNMPTELNKKPFVVGSLGVARGQDINISNDSQFFITKKDASWLNKQYTNFGIVKEGMDVVNKIEIGDKILKITVEESGHFPL